VKIVCALVLLGLLGGPALAQDSAALTAAGCGPDKVQFEVKTDKRNHTEAAPAPGQALVYVFEDVKLDSDALPVNLATVRVGLDGQWIGANHGKSFFSFSVSPGNHDVCANWQSTWVKISRLASAADLSSAASFMAEEGKIYYFQANVDERSHHQARVRLEPVDPAEAKLLITSSSLSTSHPK
jgi:hypothetical protein